MVCSENALNDKSKVPGGIVLIPALIVQFLVRVSVYKEVVTIRLIKVR